MKKHAISHGDVLVIAREYKTGNTLVSMFFQGELLDQYELVTKDVVAAAECCYSGAVGIFIDKPTYEEYTMNDVWDEVVDTELLHLI